MYPSSTNRALCSDGMRCIKPLAPSRNETNSSRVNVGADVVILGICASGTRDQETSLIYLPALRIRFLHWPVSDSLTGKDSPAGFSESWEIQSVGGRWCKAPVVSAGSSPGPRYRFRPYTAPHDNNTLRISAPAVAMTISRLPDLSANAEPPVLHPERPYRGRFS